MLAYPACRYRCVISTDCLIVPWRSGESANIRSSWWWCIYFSDIILGWTPLWTPAGSGSLTGGSTPAQWSRPSETLWSWSCWSSWSTAWTWILWPTLPGRSAGTPIARPSPTDTTSNSTGWWSSPPLSYGTWRIGREFRSSFRRWAWGRPNSSKCLCTSYGSCWSNACTSLSFCLSPPSFI